MEKRTVIDQITVDADGNLMVRFLKQIVDGGAVLSSQYHRTVVECGGNVAVQMAVVNAHLGAMGWPAVIDSSQLDAIAAVAWTPERVAAHAARKAANDAALTTPK